WARHVPDERRFTSVRTTDEQYATAKLTNDDKEKPLSFEDQVLASEALWAMNAARKGLSYSSVDSARELLKKLFQTVEWFSSSR
ncbi:unnamed protein product, partial [Didymodactylos carnosus]